MALIACHECKRQVSDTAKSCPSCGAKVKQPMGWGSKTLIGLLVIVIVSAVASNHNEPPPKTAEQIAKEAANRIRVSTAVSVARALKEQTSDPGRFSLESVRMNEDATVLCVMFREANAFGGLERVMVSSVNGRTSNRPAVWNKNCTQPLLDYTSQAKLMLDNERITIK